MKLARIDSKKSIDLSNYLNESGLNPNFNILQKNLFEDDHIVDTNLESLLMGQNQEAMETETT